MSKGIIVLILVGIASVVGYGAELMNGKFTKHYFSKYEGNNEYIKSMSEEYADYLNKKERRKGCLIFLIGILLMMGFGYLAYKGIL